MSRTVPEDDEGAPAAAGTPSIESGVANQTFAAITSTSSRTAPALRSS